MWPPQSVNTWLTPASLSVRATSSPPVILAEGATPSESPRRSLQTRLAARVAEPPRPPLGSHNRDFQTRLAARVAEPPRPPLGSHNHDFQTRLAARVAEPPRPPLGSHCHSPEFLPFDGFAVEAPGDEDVADLVDHRLAPRDIGDEPGDVGDQGPDCLGEAARPVPFRAPGARHHRMVDEAGIPACERAELRVVREPARVTRPVGEGRGASEARSEEHTSELQSPYDLVCR